MFTLEYAKNPSWNDAENKTIYLIVKWAEFQEEMPFCAADFDSEEHGRDLHNRAKNGEFGVVAPYVVPIQPTIDFEPTASE
jgi:hypothetical protein